MSFDGPAATSTKASPSRVLPPRRPGKSRQSQVSRTFRLAARTGSVFVTPGGTATKRRSGPESKDPNYRVRRIAVNRELGLERGFSREVPSRAIAKGV